ncbi:MAG: RNA polymerase sigma factor, partial [Candidatus Kapabacteria bacterium]|nr:RNA polymerase sigma factor [Candidatus Kapabacteria bacterium]
MTYSDEELYNLVADKMRISEMAFSVLYDRHSPQIWAFCLRFLGNETVAKDVFQETFLRFYNSIDGSRAINNLPGYILKIARNLCINQLNSTATFDAIPFDDDEFFAQTRQNDNTELLDLI